MICLEVMPRCLCRSTTLFGDEVVNLRGFVATGGNIDDDGSAEPKTVVGSVWEDPSEAMSPSAAHDSDDDGDEIADTDDVVAFEDRLVFADALERAWLSLHHRHLQAIRSGLAQVSWPPARSIHVKRTGCFTNVHFRVHLAGCSASTTAPVVAL